MKRSKSRLIASLFGAVAALGLAAGVAAQEPLKVGFVYLGPVGDHGWTYAHDQGRLPRIQPLESGACGRIVRDT